MKKHVYPKRYERLVLIDWQSARSAAVIAAIVAITAVVTLLGAPLLIAFISN